MNNKVKKILITSLIIAPLSMLIIYYVIDITPEDLFTYYFGLIFGYAIGVLEKK